MKRIFLKAALIAGFTTTTAFTSFTPKPAEKASDISYFAICTECDWYSSKSSNYETAEKQRKEHMWASNHYNASSTVSYDPKATKRYMVRCSKCNWGTPYFTGNWSGAQSRGPAVTISGDHSYVRNMKCAGGTKIVE